MTSYDSFDEGDYTSQDARKTLCPWEPDPTADFNEGSFDQQGLRSYQRPHSNGAELSQQEQQMKRKYQGGGQRFIPPANGAPHSNGGGPNGGGPNGGWPNPYQDGGQTFFPPAYGHHPNTAAATAAVHPFPPNPNTVPQSEVHHPGLSRSSPTFGVAATPFNMHQMHPPPQPPRSSPVNVPTNMSAFYPPELPRSSPINAPTNSAFFHHPPSQNANIFGQPPQASPRTDSQSANAVLNNMYPSPVHFPSSGAYFDATGKHDQVHPAVGGVRGLAPGPHQNITTLPDPTCNRTTDGATPAMHGLRGLAAGSHQNIPTLPDTTCTVDHSTVIPQETPQESVIHQETPTDKSKIPALGRTLAYSHVVEEAKNQTYPNDVNYAGTKKEGAKKEVSIEDVQDPITDRDMTDAGTNFSEWDESNVHPGNVDATIQTSVSSLSSGTNTPAYPMVPYNIIPKESRGITVEHAREFWSSAKAFSVDWDIPIADAKDDQVEEFVKRLKQVYTTTFNSLANGVANKQHTILRAYHTTTTRGMDPSKIMTEQVDRVQQIYDENGNLKMDGLKFLLDVCKVPFTRDIDWVMTVQDLVETTFHIKIGPPPGNKRNFVFEILKQIATGHHQTMRGRQKRYNYAWYDKVEPRPLFGQNAGKQSITVTIRGRYQVTGYIYYPSGDTICDARESMEYKCGSTIESLRHNSSTLPIFIQQLTEFGQRFWHERLCEKKLPPNTRPKDEGEKDEYEQETIFSKPSAGASDTSHYQPSLTYQAVNLGTSNITARQCNQSTSQVATATKPLRDEQKMQLEVPKKKVDQKNNPKTQTAFEQIKGTLPKVSTHTERPMTKKRTASGKKSATKGGKNSKSAAKKGKKRKASATKSDSDTDDSDEDLPIVKKPRRSNGKNDVLAFLDDGSDGEQDEEEQDEEEFIVIGVEDVRFNEASWSMEQLVRWESYEDPTWHPHSDLSSYPEEFVNAGRKLYKERKDRQSRVVCVKKVVNSKKTNDKFVAVVEWKDETAVTHEAFANLRDDLKKDANEFLKAVEDKNTLAPYTRKHLPPTQESISDEIDGTINPKKSPTVLKNQRAAGLNKRDGSSVPKAGDDAKSSNQTERDIEKEDLVSGKEGDRDDQSPLPLFVDENSAFIFITASTQYHACAKASQFEQDSCCLYALCDDCYSAKYPKTKRGGASRSKAERSPIEKARRTCCHNKEDLIARADMWWCAPSNIGTKTWFGRAHACFGCQKAFVQVPQGGNLQPKPPKDFTQFPAVERYHDEVKRAYNDHRATTTDLTKQIMREE